MKSIIKNMFLRPISWLYGAVVCVRNKLYDLNLRSSTDTAITSIGVGNITIGGTGKTPHTEYLIELLSSKYDVAYLSRGYRRKTSGFVMADDTSTHRETGDEAHQIHKKYDIPVVVDADRRRGIDKLKSLRPTTQVVLLDDIYQHRSIHTDLNILLIDYNRPIHTDHMLPFGCLRESAKNTDRADIIIVTKCPTDMQPVDMLSARVQINPFPYQNLYFSTLQYLPPKTFDGNDAPDITGYDLLVVTGIARPQHLYDHLKTYTDNISHITYPDHHTFTKQDIEHIARRFDHLHSTHRAIIITEKDRARLDNTALPENIKPHIYTIGIEIKFLFDMKEKFDADILKRTAMAKQNTL